MNTMRQPPRGDLVKVAAVGVYRGTFNPGDEDVQFNMNCEKEKQFNVVIVKLLLSHFCGRKVLSVIWCSVKQADRLFISF